MGLVSPSQSTPGSEITASSINTPINQLAAVLNGGVGAENLDATFTSLLASLAATQVTRDDEMTFDHIASGCVWSGDAYGSTRNASCTSGVVYINGKRLTVASVSARSFTASRDVYCDLKDNGDGTAIWVYYDNTTNAASPSLATTTGDMRGAIIVVGASNIANVGSVNQGQEDKVLPIASSIAYSVTDSLGNLICPRDPNRRILGFTRVTSNISTTTTPTIVDMTGLSIAVNVPEGRKVKLTGYVSRIQSSQAAGNAVGLYVREGSTTLNTALHVTPVTNYSENMTAQVILTPTAGAHTYKMSYSQGAAGTLLVVASSTEYPFILAELV